MNTYIYRGETERDFELVMTKAVGIENIYYREGEEAETEPEDPLGTIIVAKDYDNSWIASKKYFLDWEIVHAPVAADFVKGYNDPHWKVIKDHTNTDSNSDIYIIYQSPEGKIIGETLSSEMVIANSLEEYEKISVDEIEKKLYRNEMGMAR